MTELRNWRAWGYENASAPRIHPRICLSVSSFHEEFVSKRIDVHGFLRVASTHGFASVELCDRSIERTDAAYLDELREELVQLGLAVACVDLRQDFTSRDPARTRGEVEKACRWLGVAAKLGARIVRVWAGTRSCDDSAFQRSSMALRELAIAAKHLDLKLALENHGGLTSNPDLITRLVEHVDQSNFGTCPDFGWLAVEDRYDGLAKLFRLAVHAHAKAHAFDPEGNEAEIDYPRIGSIASAAGYDGFLSVEFEGPGIDRVAGVMQTAKLLQRHFLDLPPALTRDGTKASPRRAYIGRIQTSNVYLEAREAIRPLLDELARQEGVEGVALLGGLADTPHRAFVDKHSDLDIAVFLSIPEARGFRCPRQFREAHPERLPSWLPSFSFYREIRGHLMEMNCHQLILEIEESPEVEWPDSKKEAYRFTSELMYDRIGRVRALIDSKSVYSVDRTSLAVDASQLPWFGWINPRIQLERGFPLNARFLLNGAVDILMRLVFALNGQPKPHAKWTVEMACDLPHSPRNLREVVSEVLGAGLRENELSRAADLMEGCGEGVQRALFERGLVPAMPFDHVSRNLDRDRQLRSVCAADEVSYGVSPELPRDVLLRHGDVNFKLEKAVAGRLRR
jgi:sugar phosphate isomerase/epimerase